MQRKKFFSGLVFFGIVALAIFSGAEESQPFPSTNRMNENENQFVPSADRIKAQVYFFEQRYQIQNVYEKLVDNYGDSHENLYGTRNFREILRGVLYRGGANNKFNKYQKRNNTNPLQNHGLENLCEEGFARAVYLYETNFDTAKKSVRCKSFTGESVSENEFADDRQKLNNFAYQQLTAFDETNEEKFIKMIHDALTGKIESPIYMHCWNGWHASGMVSAMALQQFCNWTPEHALNYWTQNTDGNSSGYEKVKARIRGFKPYSAYKITADMQRLVCR